MHCTPISKLQCRKLVNLYRNLEGKVLLSKKLFKKRTENVSTKPPWKSLFHFTTSKHAGYVILAIALALLSGLVIPFQAYFLGKLFLALTSFGARAIDGDKLISDISMYSIYLCAVGAGNWIVSTLYYASWLYFGELQGRSARIALFRSLLEKDMAWYDMRKNGIGALIPGLQLLAQYFA